MGKGASLGEETILAGSGRKGEKRGWFSFLPTSIFVSDR
jgi:hypothetical protein